MNDAGLPFKLIISLIVVVVFRLKNQEGGIKTQTTNAAVCKFRGQFSISRTKARRKGAGEVRYLKNGRNGREDVERKTKSTRNVVEEERLCCTGGELHC